MLYGRNVSSALQNMQNDLSDQVKSCGQIPSIDTPYIPINAVVEVQSEERIEQREPVVPFTLPGMFEKGFCGVSWVEYLEKFDFESFAGPLIWSVSGGSEYRGRLEMILHRWTMLESAPILIIALDQETAEQACKLGYSAIYWDLPMQAYSKVADSKFLAAAELAARGVDALFIELDVFCRKSPLEIMKQDADLVTVSHGDLAQKINIGLYYVKATPAMRDFFQSLSQIMQYSGSGSEVKDKGYTRGEEDKPHKWFDQDMFQVCVNYPNIYEKGWYLANDTEKAYNFLELCKNHFTHSKVSNIYINSYQVRCQVMS